MLARYVLTWKPKYGVHLIEAIFTQEFGPNAAYERPVVTLPEGCSDCRRLDPNRALLAPEFLDADMDYQETRQPTNAFYIQFPGSKPS